jgi:hypothetical protein
MPTVFECRACGSVDLAGIHEYATIVHFAARAICTCGRSQHGIAAIRCFHTTLVSQDWGQLWKGAAWDAVEHEDIAWLSPTEDSLTLLCPACAEQTPHELWELTEMAREADCCGEFYYVRCYHCDGDIEPRSYPDQERAVAGALAY